MSTLILSAGQRLGPYEVLSKIGAGGMGEVYRARDTRLDRIVAVKVLSSEHTSPLRFEREAKALSSFTHPHICTIHDFGSDNGVYYLVMEYLEGETLAGRLQRGPLNIDEFYRIALDIAEALRQAHSQNLLHRDLKPANIMLTSSGAKLLDFGLSRREGSLTRSGSGTLTQALTAEGTIVGTYAYMPPEQLQGGNVDARADIFALGAVLHEMATGQPAFAGQSTASIIAAVMERDPPSISKLRPDFPSALEWIIATSLRKNPAERWHSIHDIKLQIERIREAPPAPPTAPEKRKTLTRYLLPATALLAGVGIAGLVGAWSGKPAPVGNVSRFEVPPPAQSAFSTAVSGSVPVIELAVSPDGNYLTFVADHQGYPSLWLRRMDESVPRPLQGTEGAQQPFWSPDSRRIAFFSRNALKTIDIREGAPITLCEVSMDPRGGAWLGANEIVFAPSNRDGLLRISPSGGTPRSVFKEKGIGQRWWPSPLPDGRSFLVYDRRRGGIHVGDLDGKLGERVVATDWGAIYAHPGYLIYGTDGVLVAHGFDPKRGALKGDRRQIALGVGAATSAMPGFSASNSGMLAQSPLLLDTTAIKLYSRRGAVAGQIADAGQIMDPRMSPDGRWVAWSRVDPARFAQDIWVHDRTRGSTARFTSDPLMESSPVWSADSKRILYRSNRSGLSNLYSRPLGGGADEVFFQKDTQLQAHGGTHNVVSDDWSADGRYLIYTVPGKTGFDVFALRIADRVTQPLARSAFNEFHGALSPEMKWLAFVSDETGRPEVYMQAFPDGNTKQQVSVQGGTGPLWRGDGRELYFLSQSAKLNAVSISPSGDAGRPEELFAVDTPPPSPFKKNYHSSADGQTFAVNSRTKNERPVITLTANWPALLK